jgi:hypothetical protein
MNRPCSEDPHKHERKFYPVLCISLAQPSLPAETQQILAEVKATPAFIYVVYVCLSVCLCDIKHNAVNMMQRMMHKIPCIEYNLYNTMHKIQYIECNT